MTNNKTKIDSEREREMSGRNDLTRHQFAQITWCESHLDSIVVEIESKLEAMSFTLAFVASKETKQ